MVCGRGKEGQRHKRGKRRPRLGGGRGKQSMIATWKVKEEEPHGVHTEGKDAKTEEAIAWRQTEANRAGCVAVNGLLLGTCLYESLQNE